MTTATRILELFEADLKFQNIYEFHPFVSDGFPASWARSFFRNTHLEQYTSEVFPKLTAFATETATDQATSTLSPSESQTLLHLARVYAEAFELFESRETTEQWLVNPGIALGDKAPISLLNTSVGFELVSNELQRLVYGIAG